MMHKIFVAVSWLLVIACAAAIFMLSAQTGSTSAELSGDVMGFFGQLWTRLFGEAAHTVLRKCAHFLAYCALMFLTYHACFRTRRQKRLRFVLPFVLCVLYAVSDEIHQYFVPERACRIFDVGVDTLGCIVGGLCFFLLAKFCIRIKKKKNGEVLS